MDVPQLDRVTEAFPADALSWMPLYEEIPQKFRDDETEWNDIAHQWFYSGLPEDVEFYPREGIDARTGISGTWRDASLVRTQA